MKNVFAILSLNIILFACSGDHKEQTDQPSTQPAPTVNTTPAEKPVRDSTSIEINNNGVNVSNKSGKSGTDVKIDRDSSHVIIKTK